MRKTFIFCKSYYDAIKLLPDTESKWRVINAIFEYAFEENEKAGDSLDGYEKAIYLLIEPVLDTSIRSYENGKRGGAPKGNQNARKNNKQGGLFVSNNGGCKNNSTDKDIDIDKDLDKESDKEIDDDKDCLSSIPLFPEVVDFINENQLSVDAKKFFTYYTKKNWNGVSDWQTALLGWEENLKKWDKTKVEAEEDEYAKLW
jgi:hypothetical protein